MEIEYKFRIDTSKIDKLIKDIESYTRKEVDILKDAYGNDSWFPDAVHLIRKQGVNNYDIVYELSTCDELQKRLDKIEEIRRDEFIKENEEKFLEFINNKSKK